MPLANARRERFIEEYVKDGNGSAAAVRAGYSPTSAHVTASRLLSDDNVRQAVESARVRVSAQAEMTAIAVLRELATLASSDIQHYRVLEDGSLGLVDGAPPQAMRCVSSLRLKTRTTSVKGRTSVEHEVQFHLWSKPACLQLLAKHLGLLVERHEISLTHELLVKMAQASDLELSAFVQLLPKEPQRALQLLQGGAA